MANAALLNNIDHAELRIDTRRSAELGDNLMSVLTFPDEFRNLQTHYPIVFQKTAQGSFQPVALLGFVEGQNLFLEGGRWDATCIPLAVERQPFMIGSTGDELVVHIDMDSPRVAAQSGEPVFLPHGGTTDFLERVNSILLTLHRGFQSTPAFIEALLRHDLLESFVLDIELDDGSQNRLAGFYTINEERLAALDGAALEQLSRAGHLQPIFMAVASLSNFRVLIERMNKARARIS